MKKFLFLLLLTPILGAAQFDTTKFYRSPNYGDLFRRAKINQLMIPNDTTTNKVGVAQLGSKLFVYNANKWNEIGSVNIDGKLNISDTAAMLIPYKHWLQNYLKGTDTLGLSFRINQRVPTTRTITTTAPLQGGGDLSANRTLSIDSANAARDGYLSRHDWGSFNNRFANGGNAFGNTATIGTNDNNSFKIKTNNIVNTTILPNGNIGFGTDTPNHRIEAIGDGHVSGTLKVGTRSFPPNEIDGIYVVSPQVTASVGRGGKFESHYAGTFASTGIDARAYVEGANNQDHAYGVQSWVHGNGTGTVDKVAGVMGTGTINSGSWNDFYGFYYPGVTKNNGAIIGKQWAFFTNSPDPVYLSGKLGVSPDRITESQILHPIFSYNPHGRGIYGMTHSQIGAYSNSEALIGRGGSIALGGKSGLSSDPYPFAHILGAKESASTYAGYLSFFTTSGGGVAGQTNSANYERVRINSLGRVRIGDLDSTVTNIRGLLEISGDGLTPGSSLLGLNSTASMGAITFRQFGGLKSYIGFGDNGQLLTTPGYVSGSMVIRSQSDLYLAATGNVLHAAFKNGNTIIGDSTTDNGMRLQVHGKIWQQRSDVLANSPKGYATLVNGVVTINNTLATTNCFITVNYRTGMALSGSSSVLVVSSLINTTSFTITAYNAGATTINTSDNNLIEYTISN